MGTFWLKVKKEYIEENLDDLLRYLRGYDYKKSPMGDSDFMSTIDCMTSYCDELADDYLRRPVYEDEAADSGASSTAIKIMAATMIARYNSGMDASRQAFQLVSTFLATNVNVSPEIRDCLWSIIVRLMRGGVIEKLLLSWSVLEMSEFVQPLIHQFASGTVISDSHAKVVVENKGMALLDSDRLLKLFPTMNVADFERSDSASLIATSGNQVEVMVAADDVEPLREFADLDGAMRNLFNHQNEIQPAGIVKKDYAPGDRLSVVVTSITKFGESYNVKAVSIDPRFNEIEGYIRFSTFAHRPVNSNMLSALKEGDIVNAILEFDGDKAKFNISAEFEEIYRDFVYSEYNDYQIEAIFSHEEDWGSVWITRDGVRVVIHNEIMDKLHDEDYEAFEFVEQRKISRLPIWIRTYKSIKEVPITQQLRIYALPDVDLAEDAEVIDTFNMLDADREMTGIFLDYCAEDQISLRAKNRFDGVADAAGLIPLSRLLMLEARSNDISTRNRLLYLSAARMLLNIAGREDDCSFLYLEIRFLRRIVDFVQNRPIGNLMLDEHTIRYPRATTYQQIIGSLMKYKNPEPSSVKLVQSDDLLTDNEVDLAQIDALVLASNTIVDIVGQTELNNIKRSLSDALNVEDEFRSILNERTFYGVESISLEFKKSIVFPPLNRRRYSREAADPELQQWAIMKAVCGFLNSRSGGKLILGVNDSGYADGLEEDIATLYRLKLIKEPNIDNYRLYVQRILDRAFVAASESAPSTDIGVMNITYEIERNSEDRELLHINITPYIYDLVKFAQTPPADYAESYVRHSGRTMPVTRELQSEIEIYKRKQANANTSSSDIVRLREAMKNRKVVKLHAYTSASGTSDRLIEVYKIWEKQGLIYGYDTVRRTARIYKATRWTSIEVTPNTWKDPKAEINVEIDPFGFIVSNKNTHSVDILLTKYASLLLKEEYPAVKIEENKMTSTAAKYPHRFRAIVSSLSGIARFCMGLPGNIEIRSQSLIDHIASLQSFT